MKSKCRQCLALVPATAKLCPTCGAEIVRDEPVAPLPGGEGLPPPTLEEGVAAGLALAVSAQTVAASEPARGPAPVVAPRAGTNQVARMAELRQMRNEMLLQLGRLACAEDSTPAHSFKLQVYQVQRDLDELRTGRAALAAELEAHDAVTAASTAARESELAAVAAELEPLEIAAVEAERRLGALRTEVATLQRDASRAEQAAQRLRAEIDGLGTARLSAQQRIARDAELEGQRLEQQRLARVARERASRLVTELEKAAVELERQREKRDQVANRLAELQRSIAAAKVEAARARGVLVETLAAADGRMESKTKEQTRLLEACGAMVAREWPEQSPFNVVVARLRKVEEELDSSPDLTANGSRHNPKVALIVVAVVIVVVILVLLVYALGGWAT